MDFKFENELRVIHASSLDSDVRGTLFEIEREFWDYKSGHEVLRVMQRSATYLFETIDDTEYFGKLLDKRNITYSYHLAKDYSRVATGDMDDFARALCLSMFPSL